MGRSAILLFSADLIGYCRRMLIRAAETAPTLEDVARLVGVSTATVSRCLNNSGVVRKETRARIEQAVLELGYTPHFGARALASNRTGTFGVVIPTMENAIFAHGLQAMEEELSKHNVTLLVATSGYDSDTEMQKIRALAARGVDGMGLIGFDRPAAAYAFLEARSVPFVLLWNYDAASSYPCVGFENRAAAEKMAARVADFGHRRIAMIAGRMAGNDRAAARVLGVRQALAERGLDFIPGGLIECRYSFAEGEAAAAQLLSAAAPPTAIICGNDVLAAGALRGVRSAGLRAPEDVSVVGFDDIDLAAAVDPPLTTMRAPHRRMGRAAARMLLALASGELSETRRCFDTEIVERRSLGPVPAARLEGLAT